MNEFSCIGLEIDNSDDMYDFVESHEEIAEIFVKEDRKYLRLSLGGLIELWYYSRKDNGLIDTSAPGIYHKSRYMVPVKLNEILSDNKYGPALVNVELTGGKVNFPLNLCVSDGYLKWESEELNPTGAAITMIVREAVVFEDEDSYYEEIGENGLGAESFVPTGMLPEDVSKAADFVPSATALICGRVMNSKRVKNPVSGNEYIVVGIECLGYMFDLVMCDEVFDEQSNFIKDNRFSLPAKGNIISGRCWLTGRLFE